MLAGQVHGGSVQGIGQALMEGRLRPTRPADHRELHGLRLPRAAASVVPLFETRNVTLTTNPLGVKGAGEAGADRIRVLPWLNAVVDALRRSYGTRHLDMPLTPERIWKGHRRGRRLHRL